MENEINKLLIEREFLRYKAELDKIKEENLRLQQLVVDRIDLAKSEITESAINKTMGVLEHTKKWLVVVFFVTGFFISAASFFGVKSIIDNLTVYYTDKVNNWLRFDNDNSGGRKVLEEIRTRALLDSYSIRLSREGNNTPFSIRLTGSETERLMAIVLEPKTSDSDFIDALNIIIASKSFLGRKFIRDDINTQNISDIVGNPNFSETKRGVVFDKLSWNRSLLRWSLSILDNPNISYSESMLMAAFDNVRHFDEKRAKEFAMENIDKFESDLNKVTLAKYLMQIDFADANSKINELIVYLKTNRNSAFFTIGYESIVFYKLNNWLARNDSFTQRLAEYLSAQIENGLKISFDEIQDKGKKLYFNLENSLSAIEHSDKLFGNEKLVNAVIKIKPIDYQRLATMVDFFQKNDNGIWLTTLMLKPSKDMLIQFKDDSFLNAHEYLSDIWIKKEKILGKETLLAVWRDSIGIIRSEEIKRVKSLNDTYFYVSFDKKILREYSQDYVYDEFDRL
ncbi:hypothetical protein AA106_17580 [Photorhabdus laumondii subsp. laumondii]|uniref:hypothetical protein n=1 Tax=Photorhabdus laumondii TaxID=2218628 RepID=UPI0007333BED|nr:hypothetical protein [Photorhabdus laumondii]KTL63268.1 hypothetical protein AA106_17580 [Photorhabdus laumondii subsp. laumondii]